MSAKCDFKEGSEVGPFVICRRIGHGGYGDVFSAVRKGTKRKYAIKFETALSTKKVTLNNEISVIGCIDAEGFPKIRAKGQTQTHKWFAMELYGKSLSQLRKAQPNHKFPLEFVLPIADETLDLIRNFHSFGFIHCDIKPGNFVARRLRGTRPIYMIDFGFAKLHIDPNTGKPFPQSENRVFIGTTMYASINALRGYNLCRADDLISWFYMLVELAHGKLPWTIGQKTDRVEILKMKQNATIEDLCHSFPGPMAEIYEYLHVLDYEDEPNYNFICAKINEAAKIVKTKNDQILWHFFDEYLYDQGKSCEEDNEYSLTFSARDERCII